jgi:hypothetical protein
VPTHREDPWQRDTRAGEPGPWGRDVRAGDTRAGEPGLWGRDVRAGDSRAGEPGPWGRDVRASGPRSGPPAAARQWAWALLAIAGVLAIAAGRGGPPSTPAAATPTPRPAAAPERLGVLAVRSRPLPGRRVLVWGAAHSRFRAEIGLRVHVGGVRIKPPRRVPLGADGLFESVVTVPRRLAGRSIDVKVDMYVGDGRRGTRRG